MRYSIRYNYGFDDLVAFLRAKQSLAPLGSLGRLRPYAIATILFVLLFTLGTIFSGLGLGPPFLRNLVIGLVVIMAVIALRDWLLINVIFRRKFEAAKLDGEQVTVDLDEKGLRWAGNGKVGTRDWPDVGRVVRQPSHLLLFIGPLDAVIIPRRALGSDAQFEAVETFVAEHVHA